MPEPTLPKARFHRVKQTDAAAMLTHAMETVGVWTIELQCEEAGDVYWAYAVECNPEVWPDRRFLLVVQTEGRRAFATVTHGGEVQPTTKDDEGRPCPVFPKRIWQRAMHAVERAREEDSCDA